MPSAGGHWGRTGVVSQGVHPASTLLSYLWHNFHCPPYGLALCNAQRSGVLGR